MRDSQQLLPLKYTVTMLTVDKSCTEVAKLFSSSSLWMGNGCYRKIFALVSHHICLKTWRLAKILISDLKSVMGKIPANVYRYIFIYHIFSLFTDSGISEKNGLLSIYSLDFTFGAWHIQCRGLWSCLKYAIIPLGIPCCYVV